MDNETNTVRILPPEDIEPGQYVSMLYEINDSLFSCSETPPKLGLAYDVQPVRVVEVCLPLVLVIQPDGSHRTIDVRKYRLGRVPQVFGQQVFSCIEAEEQKKKGN
jgi:hypothetical protein